MERLHGQLPVLSAHNLALALHAAALLGMRPYRCVLCFCLKPSAHFEDLALLLMIVTVSKGILSDLAQRLQSLICMHFRIHMLIL